MNMNAVKVIRKFSEVPRHRLFQKSEGRIVNVRGCSGEAAVDDEKHEETVRSKILGASLAHVSIHGWSLASMERGAESIGYPSTVHGLFPRREAHLVDHFTLKCNKQLIPYLQQLTNDEPDPLRLVERAVHERLHMIEPYANSWPQAMAVAARPSNVAHSLAALLALVDDVCWYAGDRSIDAGWYTRRVALAFIYKSSELYLVQDTSPDRQNTWRFLQRQMSDVRQLHDKQLAAQHAFDTSADVISSAFTTARNILGLAVNR